MVIGLAVLAGTALTSAGVSAAAQVEAARSQGRTLQRQGDEEVRVAREVVEERRQVLRREVGAVRARAAAAGFEQQGTPSILSATNITRSISEQGRILSAATATRSQLRSRAGNIRLAGAIGAGTTILSSIASTGFQLNAAGTFSGATAPGGVSTSSLGGGSGFGII